MMENQKIKFKRTISLVRILIKYGFKELLIRSQFSTLVSSVEAETAAVTTSAGLTVYERIRMVLEELGPTYVKFGQAFSSREDLLPVEMIIELRKLQDKVEPEEMDIMALIADELNIDTAAFFEYIQAVPFASASISQVYKAGLKNGQEVILKVRRTGIREVVTADMLIMKDVAKLLTSYSAVFRQVNLVEVLEAFEQSIFQELSFLNELANIERFSRNFKGNNSIYVSKVYPALSNDTVLCMEFIDGIKITALNRLLEMGLDPEAIARRGLDLYLKQVLEHGFFHADPHPGNLLVLKSGQLSFIDFGSMGNITPIEKELLEDLISHFMSQDSRRLIGTLKKMAIRFDIKDEGKLEKDIQHFFNLLDGASLQHIDVKEVLGRFSAILNENEILMPAHLYLLVRGIVLIEGIGRALIPDLNIIESLKPYIFQIAMRRLSPENLKKSGIKLLNTLNDSLHTIPDEIQSVISKLNNGELKVVQEVKDMPGIMQQFYKGIGSIVLAIIIAGLLISSAVLVLADHPPFWKGIPVTAIISFLFSVLLCLVLVIKRKP
ncbi:ABC1 kinase family protein [Pedobacter heparinus]|uniref:ABC1 kinase family protein n=1 Tax=Pedobacter heparinus TaxID=984 RepID=UPI00292E95A3|nr:AarF/UbiB family protein [Pedobacter heparinus]